MSSPAMNPFLPDDEKVDYRQNPYAGMQPHMQNMPILSGNFNAPVPFHTMQNMQVRQNDFAINPNHFTAYGTANNDPLPNYTEMKYARDQAMHIWQEYHPSGGLGNVTNDAIRAAHLTIPKDFNLDNLPKSADLIKAMDNDDTIITHFPDALTAEFYRTAVRPPDPVRDTTIPTTAGALRAHVVTLVHAFNSWEHADDNPGVLRPFQKQVRDQKLVECMCWTVLHACINRSKSEKPLMQSWDESKARFSPGIKTFADRFDAIVESMTISKTICKHLFDPPYCHVFVDDPRRSVVRVKANRDLNKMKAEQMSIGKRIREGEAEKTGDHTPTKRTRGSRRGQASPTDPKTPQTPSGPATPTHSHFDSPFYEDSPLGVPPNTPFSDAAQSPSQNTRRSQRKTRRPQNYAPSVLSEGTPSTPTPVDSPAEPTVEANESGIKRESNNFSDFGTSQDGFGGNRMPRQQYQTFADPAFPNQQYGGISMGGGMDFSGMSSFNPMNSFAPTSRFAQTRSFNSMSNFNQMRNFNQMNRTGRMNPNARNFFPGTGGRQSMTQSQNMMIPNTSNLEPSLMMDNQNTMPTTLMPQRQMQQWPTQNNTNGFNAQNNTNGFNAQSNTHGFNPADDFNPADFDFTTSEQVVDSGLDGGEAIDGTNGTEEATAQDTAQNDEHEDGDADGGKDSA